MEKMSRRTFLRSMGLATSGMVLAACVPVPPEESAAQTPTAAPQTIESTGGQAPMLADLVAQGELPPLAERLPKNPMVVEPVERIGVYGGTWQNASIGTGAIGPIVGNEQLVRWTPEYTDEVIPNLAESFEVNDEGTEYTFRLRQGIKWSDGEPFTADDIMFWWEDVAGNAELSPAGASDRLFPSDWGGRIEKVDDFTVVFRYDKPYGLLLTRLAARDGAPMTSHPRHYLEQFHPKYTPDADQQAQDKGYNTWVEYFGNRADWLANPEKPTLFAWKVTTPYGSDAQQVVVERNPYYFKVDPEGNQLPYIDRIVYDIVEDTELLLLKILNGEVDMHGIAFNTLENKAVVVDNQERGDYSLFTLDMQLANIAVIFLNLTYGDPVKREIFQNKDFRIGLSHAINRQEIIDAIYFGQGQPYQQAPRPESPFYNERLATQYTEYNVDLANEHLDKAGYTERDSEGFRLGPDGNRIVINGQSSTAGEAANRTEVFELVKGYWEAVGVELLTKQEGQSLFWERRGANLQEAIIWSGNGGMYPIIQPDRHLPVNDDAHFALGWQAWYNDPTSEIAMEPPEPAKQQQALWDQIKGTVDTERQAELMREILEISADEFYHIGINLWPDTYGIVKSRFHNVPDPMPRGGGGDQRFFSPSNSCQYFIEE